MADKAAERKQIGGECPSAIVKKPHIGSLEALLARLIAVGSPGIRQRSRRQVLQCAAQERHASARRKPLLRISGRETGTSRSGLLTSMQMKFVGVTACGAGAFRAQTTVVALRGTRFDTLRSQGLSRALPHP